MKRFTWVLIAIIGLGIFGCSTTGDLANNTPTAAMEFEAGNYVEALHLWEKEIADFEEDEKDVPKYLYAYAGNAAFAISDLQKAITHYELAQYHAYVDELMYENMLLHFRKIDNLSKEIMALEAYIKNSPNGLKIIEYKLRLFKKYVESENWELGFDLWPSIEAHADNDNSLIEGYLLISKGLDNNKLSDQLALKLLKVDAKNAIALESLAYKYYWKAENKYQLEMGLYEKKKTRSQYTKLIKALDLVTIDFKRSLNYYQRLYKIKPDKKYAKLLGNIYARMNDKAKSQFWKDRAK